MSIDTELYDRQIRTYGLDAVFKICNATVCIVGYNDYLSYEICKNLILSGIVNLQLWNDIYLLKDKLIELNNNININNIIDNLSFDILIVVNQEIADIIKYNSIAFKYNKKFISLISYELHGSIFIDVGKNHLIKQLNSEIYEPIQIIDINKDGIVKCNGHDYQTDDYVTFSNLDGENIDILKNKFKITVLNKTTFSLNLKINNIVFINGTCNYIQQSINISNNDFYQYLNTDIKMYEYYSNINYNKIHNQLQPVASIMGSLCVSEVIKIISNKYMPINQFFSWSETLSYEKIINLKLDETSWFIVGAGAIGCELLKNLANLNVGKIIITDPDTIEKSNLSRQFLFRDYNIGKYKSIVATEAINKINSNINIIPFIEKVGDDNKKFTDDILSNHNITGIFNALDNITARKFMDNQAFNYNLPLFESGTLGTKGNTQPVIPFLTETYSASNDPPIEKTFPVCTIKSFPNEIIHCIHWALEQFELLNTDKTPITIFNESFFENINKILEETNIIWSGGKKKPIPIIFDDNNELHTNFINTSNKIKILNRQHIFDKDNDLYMYWIFITSNLRANNYNIPISDYNYIKGIAGKIIPAVATTTSLVAGLIVIEMLKFMLKCDISEYKSTFVNLATNIFISSEPFAAPENEINGIKFNSWYKFIEKKDCTLYEFKEKYEKIFNTTISIINCNCDILYASFIDPENKLLSEIISNNKIISLISEDENIILPNIYINI